MNELESPVAARDVYTVSRINREARAVLSGAFPLLWVEGEVSNLKRYRSGHWYFSLKDPAAQVSCAMFRNRNALVDFLPDDGMQVLIRARVELYENRGQFQLIAEHMEPAGEGALRRAFDDLKQKLKSEGLFEPSRRKPIPLLPRRIAVITSPEGAAIRDILSVLGRRFPAIPVSLYGVPVQGDKAAAAIARAIDAVNAHGDCELIILARGGGSLEDLWAFNEELVARAIADCPLPVITGVGHETDFTIADFVADLRAPTPSVAAESAVPDQLELRGRLTKDRTRLDQWIVGRLGRLKLQAAGLSRRLNGQSPGSQLQQRSQRLDELQERLQRARNSDQQRRLRHMASLNHRLVQKDPRLALAGMRLRVDTAVRRLRFFPERLFPASRARTAAGVSRLTAWREHRLPEYGRRLAVLAGKLDTVSPLATLKRGYAMVTDNTTGKVIDDAAGLKEGQTVNTRLAKGGFSAVIKKVKPG